MSIIRIYPHRFSMTDESGKLLVDRHVLQGTIDLQGFRRLLSVAEAEEVTRGTILSFHVLSSKPLHKPDVDAALGYGTRYGGIDGGHHKAWVIDQMLRALMGMEQYAEFIARSNADGFEHDAGIAP